MKYFWGLLTLAPILFFAASPIKAQENSLDCEGRYLTLVNPVRGRDKWSDRSISPLINQYALLKENGLAATWLLQYDALIDEEITSTTKNFDTNQEIGVFVEISPSLAKEARVIYPPALAWSNPSVLFLSGYTQSERRKLIDTLFEVFNKTYGYYPKSVGAWWIDSYSLNYMEKHYGIEAVLIVADQRTTDNYGVWGQWWGVAYLPSKANILTPARSSEDKTNLVVIQWAQRDLTSSYGEGPAFSNHSLQANDYISLGNSTSYFSELVKVYLGCQNQIGQITVGLETGIESSAFLVEYERQLTELKKISNLKDLKMSEFANEFKSYNTQNPKEISLQDGRSEWLLTPEKRVNRVLGDETFYNPKRAFFDYFLKDDSNFLDRSLESELTEANTKTYFPYYIFVWGAFSLLMIYKKKYANWALATLFLGASFGLILKSAASFGWMVYYGPKINYLEAIQVLGVIVVFAGFYWLKKSIFLLILPLIFGIDALVTHLRYTQISGSYYFGVAWDALRFIGAYFKSPFNFGLINRDFPNEIAVSLLKFDLGRIWRSTLLSIIIYPLVHIIAAFIVYRILKKTPSRVKLLVICFLIILFALHLRGILISDPSFIVPL